MSEIEEWLEEVLFRGRPPSGPDSDKEATFHVIIGQQVPSAFGPDQPPQRRFTEPLTPAQAEAAGWPLKTVVKGLNTALLDKQAEVATERDMLREQLAQANEAVEAITAERDLLALDLAAMRKASLQDAIEAAERLNELRSKLAGVG